MERILVIGMSGDCGGIENYILNTYEHIDHSKLQFDFLVKEEIGEAFESRISSLGGRVFVVGTFKKNVVRSWKRIREVYRKGKYNKVYVNLSYSPTLIYVLPGLKENVREVFIHSHASDDIRRRKHKIFQKTLIPILERKSKVKYLGCSKDACYWMFGKDACKKKGYTVINNAIDYEKFKYKEEESIRLRQEYGLNNAFVVGHVGRFSAEKNHIFIIDTFNELHKLRADTKLLLVGDGELRESIEKQVNALGLSSNVIFTGVVQDSYRYYNAMDCFWLPSIYEGLPMVAIEAQVNGLRCLISNRVNNEVDILKKCKFLGIENSVEYIQQTMKVDKKYRRIIEHEDVISAGYDLDKVAESVMNLLSI